VRRGRTKTAAVALGAVALALSGCGRDGDRQSVRTVVDGFYAAVRDHQGDRACALLSVDTRQALEQEESESCGKAVGKLHLDDGRPGSVRVFSSEASVELVGGDAVFLGDTKGGWRISAAGCRLQGDKPADCELED
jgi:hypothetical protein